MAKKLPVLMNTVLGPKGNAPWPEGATMYMDPPNGIYMQNGVLMTSAAFFTSVRNLACDAPNKLGQLINFPVNTPRITDAGLILESGKQQAIRNSKGNGVITGTPGTDPTNWNTGLSSGVNKQIVGTGVEDGLTYIDYRYWSANPLSTAAVDLYFEAGTTIPGLVGETWVGSFYAKIVGGSLANIQNFRQDIRSYTSAPAFLDGTFRVVALPFLTGKLGESRIETSRVLSATSNTVNMNLNITLAATGVPFDITIRVARPQLEKTTDIIAASTSIESTSAAVLRPQEVVTVTNVSQWYDQAGGTLYTEGCAPIPVSGSNGVMWSLSDGTNITNEIMAYIGSTAAISNTVECVAGGGSQGNVFSVGGTVNANSVFKHIFTFSSNIMRMAINGASHGTEDTTVVVPSNVTTFKIGARIPNYFFSNMLYKKMWYVPASKKIYTAAEQRAATVLSGEPANFNGLKLHLDAKKDYYLDAGGTVNRWDSQVAPYGSFLMPNPVRAPLYRYEGLANKNAIKFRGAEAQVTGDYMQLDNFANIADNLELMVVCQKDMVEKLTASSPILHALNMILFRIDSGNAASRVWNGANWEPTGWTAAPAVGVPAVLGMTYDKTNIISYVNGVAGTPTARTSAMIPAGYYTSIQLNYFFGSGDFSDSEIVLYDRKLQADERAAVVAYLRNKWGI